MSRKTIRILIADDNVSYRRGVRIRLEQVPEFVVIGEVASGRDAIAAATAERADVVLMDLQMPRGNGLDATRALTDPTAKHPVAVVVVTNHPDDRFVIEALDAGAVGYLLKNHDTTQLVEAIRSVVKGAALVSTRVTPTLLREFARRRDAGRMLPVPSTRVLSRGQLALARALSLGYTSNETLAEHLGVSINTVRSQLQAALKKTGLADRTQLALWGVRHGLDRPETSSDRTTFEK